ncbi:MAG: hypothetical protein CBD27_00055 [Rhodospirillaceae bacterium TMED167]|nr:hypothetical protein [Rhodospirillaceae bacterium]OUW31624.1 MAG: hypothetical protein CBD27_00055 [Rhodospirillaceae bacterium TMED167]
MDHKGSRLFGSRWLRFLTRYFPDRELILRTDVKVWFIKISHRTQFAGLGLIVLLSGWGIFSSFSFFINDKIIEAKDNEILNTRLVYRNLLSEISNYQGKFTALTQELEKNHGLMLNLVEKNATLQQNLMSAESKLMSSKQQRDEIAVAKDDLKHRLTSIEKSMRNLNTRNFELKGNLSSVTGSLESALAERNEARLIGDRLTNQVADLKKTITNLNESEKNVVARLTRKTSDEISNLETFIDRTGLKARKLTAKMEKEAAARGQGGPFVEISPNAEPGVFLKASISNLDHRVSRLQNLRELVSIMPLAAPMDYFSISSHFGKRKDPINRRWAMHYGLDLVGAIGTRVYVTAPGKVVKAGVKGKFGKFIEVDHGRGFKTRYGHLNKILVKRGQKVEYRQKIGLLGNTGRSTGPHLHYEILHNGNPRNPWRFIKAGRYVYKK